MLASLVLFASLGFVLHASIVGGITRFARQGRESESEGGSDDRPGTSRLTEISNEIWDR